MTTWCLASRFPRGSKICITPLGGHQSSGSVCAAHFFSSERLRFDSAFFTPSLGVWAYFPKWPSGSASVLKCPVSSETHTHTQKYIAFTYKRALRHTYTNLSIYRSVYLFSKYLYSTTPHYGSLLCNHSCKVRKIGYDCINSISTMSTVGSKLWCTCTSVFK